MAESACYLLGIGRVIPEVLCSCLFRESRDLDLQRLGVNNGSHVAKSRAQRSDLRGKASVQHGSPSLRELRDTVDWSPSAGVVKLADTQDLGSCAFGRAGSSPAFRTELILRNHCDHSDFYRWGSRRSYMHLIGAGRELCSGALVLKRGESMDAPVTIGAGGVTYSWWVRDRLRPTVGELSTNRAGFALHT